MDWAEFGRAVALVMILEGLMPFAFPQRWRTAMAFMVQQGPRSLRIMGLCSMVAGVVVLQLL